MKQLLLFLLIIISLSCTRKIYVAPETAECIVGKNGVCYLIKGNLEENWFMIAEDILGFDFENGYLYRLKVKKVKVVDDFGKTKNAYQLIETLSKELYKPKNKSAETSNNEE